MADLLKIGEKRWLEHGVKWTLKPYQALRNGAVESWKGLINQQLKWQNNDTN